jgi:hypothetical protein
MKVKKLNIKIFGWKVILVEIKNKNEFKKVIKIMKPINLCLEDIKYIKNNMKCHDGGDYFYNTSNKKSVILIYPITSKRERRNVLEHEKRHLVDRILENCHIKDIETSAYLTGFISEKFY